MIWLLPVAVLGLLLLRHEDAQSPAAVAARINPAGGVILYETAWCSYCRLVERCLTASGVAFEKRDIEASTQWRDEFRALGGRGVPLTLIGEVAVRGWNGRAIDAALAQMGHQGRCG